LQIALRFSGHSGFDMRPGREPQAHAKAGG
jgi:hypothetical protein